MGVDLSLSETARLICVLCRKARKISYRYTIYIFEGSCLLTEYCQVQNSLCVQVLRSPILAALLHGTRAVGVNQISGVVQGMELRNFRSSSFSSEDATYILRAAITLAHIL